MAMIKNGQHVIVKRARDTRLLFVKAGTTGGIGKVKFDFSDVVGRYFGVRYEVRQKKLHPCAAALQAPEIDSEDPSEDISIDVGTGKQDDQDESERSKMDDDVSESPTTAAQIEKMRKAGSSGHEIITKLALDNPTFRHKTAYAREKYLTKKEKKHSAIVTIYPPTIRMVHEIYYSKDADKICYLRQDCLAHLLTWTNVHHGCRTAVIEQCLGIVTAAVLERMAGAGHCVRLHKGATLQSIPCLAAMDFGDAILDVLAPVPLDDFLGLRGDSMEKVEAKSQQEAKKAEDEDADLRIARREDREARKAIGIQLLKDGGLDSFIMAVKEHPLDMMQRLLACTRPSRPFVVYSCYVQPLLECYQWLRDENKAVNIQLMDTFFRKHQILPGRSHPEMSQPVAGGYILTGITII